MHPKGIQFSTTQLVCEVRDFLQRVQSISLFILDDAFLFPSGSFFASIKMVKSDPSSQSSEDLVKALK